ncbi:FUSC family protein [Ensifer soli]|uniref:FUSC family protein n=1 Tax=Ciceribacter sp. sgz301302 TaxID=3342379 RepID=UPI0035B8A7DB
MTIRRLRDWLLANDPAFSRVRMAGRVTVTILVTLAMLAAMAQVWALPPAAYGLAITLAIQSGLSVRDLGPARQFVTRLIGCGAALVIVTLAALLEPYRMVSDLVFLAVVFAASFARSYGPRWMAVGMFAFMSYFIGAYLHPSPDQIPAVAAGVLTAALVAHLVSTVILPDRWQRDLSRTLVALDARIGGILDDLAAISATGEVPPARRRQVMARVSHFKDAMLMAESLLPRPASEAPAGDDPALRLTLALFDLHLAVESAAVLGLQSPPQPAMLDAVRGRDGAALARLAEAMPPGPAAETAGSLVWLDRARRAVTQDVAAVLSAEGLRPPAPPVPPAPSGGRISLDAPAMRSAIQITLAAAVAMVFGLMLSRERWFWAVLSAFLVFTNTRSRGDTMLRALQRSGGTLLGLVAGVGVAALLSGHVAISALVALSCIFLAFYMLQVSYAAMTFFVSIVLALAYGMMGVLTPGLMVLRLEETLIGSAAGMAVAFLVFPTRTRATLDAALTGWYDAMDALLSAGPRDGVSALAEAQALAQAQALERAYRDVAAAARPLGSSWQVVTRPGHVRQTLALMMAATYWAKMAVQGAGGDSPDPAALDGAKARLAALRASGSECFYVPRPVRSVTRRHLPLSERKAALALEMVGLLLDRLKPVTPG